MSTIEHDMNNPSMEVGTRYPNMKDFRLVVRQYAINKEFELGIARVMHVHGLLLVSRRRVKCLLWYKLLN